MDRVVAAFVGYAPNFTLPYQVGRDHGEARSRLAFDREDFMWDTISIPECEGFVIMDDAGNLRYADRTDSYRIAEAAGQLVRKTDERYPRLNSFQIADYDGFVISDIQTDALELNKSFGGKSLP